MRIALVTEDFGSTGAPGAHLARQVVARLTDGGHEVVVFAVGRGQATFRGARVSWASRMTPVSAIREAMVLSRIEVCHLVDPHRLGLKAAEAADRAGVPVVVLDPRRWAPGVDLHDHHPRLRDQALHDRWARAHAPDGGQLIAGYVGPLDRRKVIGRLARVTDLPGVRVVAVGQGRDEQTAPGIETLRGHGAKVIPTVTSVERAQCLASFDVLLQPRKRQPYAPAVLEALASGVPVVAFDGGGSGVVRHEVNGLLVDSDRGGKAFARAVARVAASPDLRFGLADQARPSVSGRTWDDAVAELVDLHYPAAVTGEVTPALSSGR